jgi:type I restriction enzyme S subunit
MEAPAGNVAQIPDEKGYILSQRTVSFVPKASIMTNDFLAGLLSSPVTQARIIQLATGGTAQGISQRSLRLLTVTYPTSIREQTLISSSVRVLSKTIALHQRKFEQLKKIKQALLQKMFV